QRRAAVPGGARLRRGPLPLAGAAPQHLPDRFPPAGAAADPRVRVELAGADDRAAAAGAPDLAGGAGAAGAVAAVLGAGGAGGVGLRQPAAQPPGLGPVDRAAVDPGGVAGADDPGRGSAPGLLAAAADDAGRGDAALGGHALAGDAGRAALVHALAGVVLVEGK